MLFREDTQQSNNMEQEHKIKIEETSLNFGYVKKEPNEEELEFKENQYKISSNFENMYGGNSLEVGDNKDSLICFLDGDIMKTKIEAVKLDVKEETNDPIQKNMELYHCNKCGGKYDGYCPNCSSLSHILNNFTPNLNPEPILNTVPINILEIREVLRGQAIFALKTLPKGIILGPFEGIAPIKSTTGLQWKIKDKKLVINQNGNWTKYIQSVTNPSYKNLGIFQLDGILYFETSRQIEEGEELLVCYWEDKDVLKIDNDEELYLVPVKKEEYPKVFACTLCCLGFRLEECLVEHKSNCLQGNYGNSIEAFEIIQCSCCKVWLEKQEHFESHMQHCLLNFNRLCHNKPDFQRKPTNEIDEISRSIDENRSYLTVKEVMYPKYSNGIDKIYKSYKNREEHLNTQNKIKPFECDICKKRFTREHGLKIHLKDQHSNTSEKEYKCAECSYQTNLKYYLKLHLNTHKDVKPYQCDFCKKEFSYGSSLRLHLEHNHSNTSEKKYKCPECSFQTNRNDSLKEHLNRHNDIKPYECGVCKMRYVRKNSLKLHFLNQHSNTVDKKHKCTQCSYQTNRKGNLKIHFNIHQDIKPNECDICKMRFTHKSSLKWHMTNKHSNKSQK